jgi:hypothetical protein
MIHNFTVRLTREDISMRRQEWKAPKLFRYAAAMCVSQRK